MRGLLERLHDQRERHRRRALALRLAVGAAGFVLVVVGIVLIPLPGPGLLVIASGLFLLALEFTWAEKALERTVARLERTAGAAASASPLRKGLVVFAFVLGLAAAVVIAVRWDVPVLPV